MPWALLAVAVPVPPDFTCLVIALPCGRHGTGCMPASLQNVFPPGSCGSLPGTCFLDRREAVTAREGMVLCVHFPDLQL